MQQRILIAEDDPDSGALLRMRAPGCGADVRLESDGRRALLAAQAAVWDLIVLDWRLPGLDGIVVCERLRAARHGLPILMLTARTSEADHVRGLDAGADDYVDKPFSITELQARLRAQLRRAIVLRTGSGPAPPTASLTAGALVVDPVARAVRLRGEPLDLTVREFDLLAHFVRHPGRVFSRSQLLAHVWGAGFEGYEHTVNSHINRLRAKVEHDAGRPRTIVTVWGVRYRFDPDSGP